MTDLSERQKDRKETEEIQTEKKKKQRRGKEEDNQKKSRRSSPVSLFVLFACVEPRGGALGHIGFSVLAGAQTISRAERKKGSISDLQPLSIAHSQAGLALQLSILCIF